MFDFMKAKISSASIGVIFRSVGSHAVSQEFPTKQVCDDILRTTSEIYFLHSCSAEIKTHCHFTAS